MQKTRSDHLIVTAIISRQKSQHPWGEDLWALLGLLQYLSNFDLTVAEAQGKLIYCPTLVLQLHPLHCHSYYHNLISEQPKIFLVCNLNAIQAPQPLLITVDYDEAASYMETGELVLAAPLTDDLCVWLERFVLANYRPEKPNKRRRQRWHKPEQ